MIKHTKLDKVLFAILLLPFIIMGSTKPSPPVVVTDGIKLTNAAMTSKTIDLDWTTTDERCTGRPFTVQLWNNVDKAWRDMDVIPAGTMHYHADLFMCDRDSKWRISCEAAK